MLRTYSLRHDLNFELEEFLIAYNNILNSILKDIWSHVEWKEKPIKGKKSRVKGKKGQVRVLPVIPDYSFKKELREKYLKDWKYAAHWVDSAIKTAFSIINSWKANYKKGNRKRKCPQAKRLFARVKQSLMKKEEEKLRITIKPREFVYIDLSKRYFKLSGRIGEPVITLTHIYLPIEKEEIEVEYSIIMRESSGTEIKRPPITAIGWDCNKYSLDGFSPEFGWISIDLKELHTLHITYDNKRRRVNKVASRKKHYGKELKRKYRSRERNRTTEYIHILTNELSEFGYKHGFEDLSKEKMYRKRKKKWNRELAHTDWRKIVSFMEYKSNVVQVDPYNTSKTCSACGWVNKELKGEKVFRCEECGLTLDRQLNAAINIYLRMEGLSPNMSTFFRSIVRPLLRLMKKRRSASMSIWSRFTLTGMERKEPDELTRVPHDSMKSKFYVNLLTST